MKKLFIPILKDEINLDNLKFPNRFILAYSIQYEKTAKSLKKKFGKRVKIMQVLGCSKLKSNLPIVILADGNFHALNLALQNKIVYKIEKNKLKKFDKKLLEKYQKRIKAGTARFLYSDKIGIIVSIKPGQEQLNLALSLKKKLKKKSYVFLTNNINTSEFENFPLDIYVNTACPTIIYDSSKIINYKEIEKLRL